RFQTMTHAEQLFRQAHNLMRQSSGGSTLGRAAELMKRAADLGHIGAANNYGAMLQHGRGMDEDLEGARAYYGLAAQADFPAGQFNFGFMWLHGLGGACDPQQARNWFERAASQDEPDALTHMGRMCMTGEGGPQDFAAARQWWEQGANAGDNRCAFNLGVACAGGHGAPPDFVEALKWFRLAEQFGNRQAAAEIAKLKTVMSDKELRCSSQPPKQTSSQL
ncbi:MAG: tetratricopeptide repeat protein, partial [Pseudomonadota bacterium]